MTSTKRIALVAVAVAVAVVAIAAGGVASGCATAAAETKVGPAGKLETDRLELARLKRDILKVDKSLEVTKGLIARSKGERYLPDLYFRQAELLIEKSRLVYFRVLEEQ